MFWFQRKPDFSNYRLVCPLINVYSTRYSWVTNHVPITSSPCNVIILYRLLLLSYTHSSNELKCEQDVLGTRNKCGVEISDRSEVTFSQCTITNQTNHNTRVNGIVMSHQDVRQCSLLCGLNVIVLISISFNRSCFFFLTIFSHSKLITRILLSCSNLQMLIISFFIQFHFLSFVLSFLCRPDCT